MSTHSTDEAMSILKATRRRLINLAREVARSLIAQTGFTTTEAVRQQMILDGTYDDSVKGYWLGAVFNRAGFIWTGRYQSYTDDVRNIHERTVKVWTL